MHPSDTKPSCIATAGGSPWFSLNTLGQYAQGEIYCRKTIAVDTYGVTVTELQNESEAVAKAAREFLRMTQLRELKAVSGKVDYCDAGDELEAMELRELPPNSV